MTLDIRTLLVSYFCLSVLSGAISSLTWRLSRRHLGGGLQWFLGFICLSLGMAGLAARGIIPDFLSIIAANALVMAGGALEVWGVGKALGVEKSRLYLLLPLVFVLALGALAWFSLIETALKPRVLVLSAFYTSICAIGVILLLAKPIAASKRGARFAAAFFILLGGLFAARGLALPFWDGGQDWLTAGAPEALSLLLSMVLTTGIAFAQLHLVNARLLADYQEADAQSRERSQALLAEGQKRKAAEDSLMEANAEIASAQKEIMVTLAEVVENRSEETAHHVLRVSEYARVLTRALDLPDEEASLISEAAPMHDIGKIAVPDSVLKKPGPLDGAELRLMRSHTSIGRDILSKSHRRLMKVAATIAYEHHEYWNGTGYPEGKAGEAISLAGRIVSVCDVFDALAVSRVYKQAWDLPRIMNFFASERGRMFEPRLVDALERNLSQFVDVSRRWPDSGTITHS